MFPLSYNANDAISCSDQQAYNMPLFSDIISYPKQDVPPPLSLCLPSPFIPCDQQEFEDHLIFLQQNYDLFFQEQPLRATVTSTNLSQSTVVNNMADSNKSDVIELTGICNKKSNNSTDDQILRKRSSKRDRHSKINTAQGPRDRRMRLSLKVAREFFDLQDKLRFDKASKTVEWLLIQAKNEIKKLSSGSPHMNYSGSDGTKSASSTSAREMLPEINIETTTKGRNVSKGRSSPCVKKERTRRASSRKTPFNPFAKESREKARARARERTKEKYLCSRRIDKLKFSEESSNNELNQFAGCWDTPLETGDQESGTHNFNPSLEVQLAEVDVAIYHEREKLRTPEGMIDENLVIMGKYWSPSFPNNLHNTGTPDQEHQFSDFQYKTWDQACTIGSMC